MNASNHNNGGPAFPAQDWQAKGNHHPGMSLRDWFAGQALAGFAANPGLITPAGDFQRSNFAAAYKFADAMLAERNREEAAK